MVRRVGGYGHRVVLIGAEPGIAAVEPSTNFGRVIVEDYVLAVDSAGQLHRGNFYLGGLVAGYAGVGDRDSPKQRGFEIGRRRDWVHVACFVFNFVGNAGGAEDPGLTSLRQRCRRQK